MEPGGLTGSSLGRRVAADRRIPNGYGAELADLVAASGGILGGVMRAVDGVHGRLLADIDSLFDTLLHLASERGLDVDLHVDESGDAAATVLAHVAAAVCANNSRVAWKFENQAMGSRRFGERPSSRCPRRDSTSC
jgi:hypothetical protein